MKWHNARQEWFDRADRSLHNARKKARYRDNPEAGAAKAAAWRAAHPEAQKEIERRRRGKHGPTLKARNAKWRAENAEYVRETAQQYHAQNRSAMNAARKKLDHHTKALSPWIRCLRARENKARHKKLPFDLTDDWARSRWKDCCELTGIPFATHNPYGNFFSPSIDRIDASKGYVQDNCRFILFAVNAFKGTGTDADMLRVVSALYARHVQLPPLKL